MRFVGRSGEMEELTRSLSPAPLARVAWLTGPAGVGKTALARHFAARCSASGSAVQWIACEEIASLRDELAVRVGRLRAARTVDAPASVIVLDGFDRHEGLDRWLLEEAPGEVGHDAVIIVTARRRVSASLRTIPDPRATLREHHLGSLAPDEMALALTAAGVPRGDHERVFALTKGHPLTLALVVERFAQEPDLPLSLSDEPGILGDIVADLLRDAPATDHRLALHALAIAGLLDESLLGRATNVSRPHELFIYLSTLSIVERSKHGLIAQSLVRDVLYREHALRNPDEHAMLVSRIAEGIQERRRRARTADETLRLDAQAAFVGASTAALRECCDFRWLASVAWREAAPAELPALAAQIASFEGAEEGRRFAAAAPSARVFVLAHHDGALASVATLIDEADERTTLRWLSSPTHHAMGRALWTTLVAVESTLREAGGTRELVLTVPEGDALMRHLPALGFAPLSRPAEDGTASFVLPIAPFEEGDRAGAATPSREREASSSAIDRGAFDAAWRAALPLLHRPHDLARSPLLETALGREGPSGLLSAATAACAALASSSGYADSARVIDVSLIHPAAKQEAAAALLGVPFGTYRYQLRKATALLLEELWRRECSALQTPETTGVLRV